MKPNQKVINEDACRQLAMTMVEMVKQTDDVVGLSAKSEAILRILVVTENPIPKERADAIVNELRAAVELQPELFKQAGIDGVNFEFGAQNIPKEQQAHLIANGPQMFFKKLEIANPNGTPSVN